MNEDGFAVLAARSARFRKERRLLLEGLKAFEQKIIEMVDGLGYQGSSKDVVLAQFTDYEFGPVGHTVGYLWFNGSKLFVACRDEPHQPWDDEYAIHEVEEVDVEWQRRLSDPEILESLLQDLIATLDEEIDKTAPLVASLSQFVAVEKAQIDADVDAVFDDNPILYESWVRARQAVTSDPELSILLSCSHLETVLKRCLKQLGGEGYEDEPVERLMSKAIKLLREAGTIDGATQQMLNGASTICHGVAAIRNRKSIAHGKNEGYVQPTPELAQTLNHLAGVVSVFVMKHTTSALNG